MWSSISLPVVLTAMSAMTATTASAEETAAPPQMRLGLGEMMLENAACSDVRLDPNPPFWVTDADQSDEKRAREKRDYDSYKIWDNARWPERDASGTVVDFPVRAVVLRGDYAIPRIDNFEEIERNGRTYVPVTIVGTRDGRILEDFDKTHTIYGRNHRESEIGRYLVGDTSIVGQRVSPGTLGYLSARALGRPNKGLPNNTLLNELVSRGAENVHIVKEDTIILGYVFPQGTILSLATEEVPVPDGAKDEKQTMYKIRECCYREREDECYKEHVFNVRSFGQDERYSFPKYIDVNSVCGFHFMRRLQPVELESIGAMEALRASIARRLTEQYSEEDRDVFAKLLREAQGNFGAMNSIRLQQRTDAPGNRRIAFSEATETLVRFPGLVPARIDRGKGEGKDSGGNLLYEMFDFHEPNGCKLVHYKSAVNATDAFMLPGVACAIHEAVCVTLREDPECKDSIVQMGECFAPAGVLGKRSLHQTHFTGYGVDFRAIRESDTIMGFGHRTKASRTDDYSRRCNQKMMEAFIDKGANRIRFEDWKILNALAIDILVERAGMNRNRLEKMDGPTIRQLAKEKLDVEFDYDNHSHIGHFHVDFNPDWILKRAPACAPKPL